MLLEIKKPSKQMRVELAVAAVAAVDAMRGEWRCTKDRREKEMWLDAVFESGQVQAWAGGAVPLPVRMTPTSSGGVAFGAHPMFPGALVFHIGPREMTDVDLAVAAARGARYGGWPEGTRKAAGAVSDPAMLMLAVAALWVHSPPRACELWKLFGELGLNVAAPVGGWDPAGWS